jgi:serine/threonine-protein kinase
MGDWNRAGAEAEFKRAIEHNPNDAGAHYYFSYFLAASRRFEEAFDHLQQAQILDPLSAIINTCVGTVHVFAQQFDLAISQLLKTLELNPHFPLAYFWLTMAYEKKEMYTEALEASRQAATMFKSHPEMTLGLSRTLALLGRREEALRLVGEIQELSKSRYVCAYYFVPVYAALNETDHAFEWLERAYRERPWWMVCLDVDPRLDSIRSDSRFVELRRRVGVFES